MKPQLASFFDTDTGTISYVVSDPATAQAAVIDPVLDYDPKAGRTSTKQADRIIRFVQNNNLHIAWVLETHAHADHLSAAQYIKQELGGKIAIGENICHVQAVFKTIFHLDGSFTADGKAFDHLIKDGEQLSIGHLTLTAMFVPGHTPADMAYMINDMVFVGDTLFMPDVGTARCDFPGGNAQTLYQSIRKILSLPDETRLFMCHDYPPEHRQPAWETTVAEQKKNNIHVKANIDEASFVAMRQQRDKTLDMPRLILPAIQINIRAGKFPPAEENGMSYLKIPLNVFG